MGRALTVVGAPSNIGIRPYDDGVARHLNRAPQVLRERGLIARLGATDLGDVAPPRYRDFVRPPNRARNEDQLVAYSRSLAQRVFAAIAHGQFGVVVGGDCSIVLGCLIGARKKTGDAVGLVYVDAHADFASPEGSPTGSASGMALALATGRGDTALSRLGGSTPLVGDHHVALLGRRDDDSDGHGHAALAQSSILDVPSAQLLADDWLEVAATTLDRVAPPDVRGFWIQVDADVLDPITMAAVDSPEPGGPIPRELLRLLTPLVQHPRALGLSLTTYDPALDPDRSCARRLVNVLEALLAPGLLH
jgi:arginase